MDIEEIDQKITEITRLPALVDDAFYAAGNNLYGVELPLMSTQLQALIPKINQSISGINESTSEINAVTGKIETVLEMYDDTSSKYEEIVPKHEEIVSLHKEISELAVTDYVKGLSYSNAQIDDMFISLWTEQHTIKSKQEGIKI